MRSLQKGFGVLKVRLDHFPGPRHSRKDELVWNFGRLSLGIRLTGRFVFGTLGQKAV